jgi:hypothetical protein
LPAPRPTARVESVPGIIGQVAVLTVRDAGRSAAWYCELLGTGETGRYVQPDGRVALVHLAGPRSALEQCLVSHDSAHAQIPYREKNEPQSQKDANRAHAKLARRKGERPAPGLADPPQAVLLPLACRATGQGHPRSAGPRGTRGMKMAQWWPPIHPRAVLGCPGPERGGAALISCRPDSAAGRYARKHRCTYPPGVLRGRAAVIGCTYGCYSPRKDTQSGNR